MESKLVIVTGFFGAPIRELAEETAKKRELPLLDLDEIIETEDGHSIRRIVMMYGEHQYRNLEYQHLKELMVAGNPAVVLCGDGVLHDDDSRAIIEKCELLIAGENLSEDRLWERAVLSENSYHAFMSFGDEREKRDSFTRLLQRQKTLFDSII